MKKANRFNPLFQNYHSAMSFELLQWPPSVDSSRFRMERIPGNQNRRLDVGSSDLTYPPWLKDLKPRDVVSWAVLLTSQLLNHGQYHTYFHHLRSGRRTYRPGRREKPAAAASCTPKPGLAKLESKSAFSGPRVPT